MRSHIDDYGSEDDDAAWIARQLGPRQVGGRYYSGSRDQEYEVVTVDDEPDSWGQWEITVRWDDDHESTHCTPWAPDQDHVIATPPAAGVKTTEA